jgi:resuscitation-promoting factor RpfB
VRRLVSRPRPAVIAVYGVVTAALVGATVAYVTADKTVSVSVDGQVTRVHTFAASVGSVLHRAGVQVGTHDSVSPALKEKVHDGTTISIERGRQLDLTIDGQTRDVWVTATSVDDALQQAGLRVQGAVMSADRSARVPLDGLAIDIELPHTVTVVVDGSTRTLISAKTTVGALLAEAGITLNPADQISVPLDTRPAEGMSIVIVRISSAQQLSTTSIPFTATTRNDSSILVGTKVVTQQGKNGTLESTYQLTYTDGVQTAKALIDERVSVPPVSQVTSIGTKPKPVPKPKPKPKPKAAVRTYVVPKDGLNWGALAACESGGRATANNGRFYGLYQFSLGTWRDVGGTGLPSQASPSEQTYRAQLLYKRSNWRSQWPVCGSRLFS